MPRFRTARILIAVVLPAVPALAQVKPPFRAPLVVANETDQIVKTLDLNGDGWTDAMGWWTVQQGGSGNPWLGHLAGWLNDGTGQLVRTWSIEGYTTRATDPIPVDACETGDLDHDGDDDFAVISGSKVRVYVSNGSSAPDLAIEADVGLALKGVALADFDTDGDLDVAVEHLDRIAIHRLLLGSGSLQLMSSMVTNFSNGGRLVAAELTGDATPDLLVSGSRLYPVIAGVIQAPTSFPDLASDSNLRHDAGDIDGDGDLDVVSFVLTSSPAKYRVLRRTSAATLVAEAQQPGGPARRLYDVDGDGDLDGICCGGSSGPVPFNVVASTFRIALNDGAGAFATAFEIKSMGSQAIAGVSDLDHDGDVDLVAGRAVYYADGPIRSAPWGVAVTSIESTPLVARDIDADGDPDWRVLASSMRENRGDGVAADASITLPAPPAGTTRSGVPQTGDWDGDGDIDLLMRVQPAAIELLTNVGGGAFVSAGIVAGADGMSATGAPYRDAVVAADVDGDGDTDFVSSVGSFDVFGSSIWRNDGAAGFTWLQRFSGVRVVAAADLDGDRGVDLVAIGPFQSPTLPISWAHGGRNASFGAWQTVAGSSTGGSFDQVAVADLDSDGDVDIAAIFEVDSDTAQDAHVFWNDGLGNFTRELVHAGEFVYELPTIPFSTVAPLVVIADDVDLDGRTDLVLGPCVASPYAATILRADPANAGAFLPPVQQIVYGYASGSIEYPLATADIDGDGDRDLLTTSSFLNRTREQPEAGVRVQLGTGGPGFGGVTPILGATGPFETGETVQLLVRGLRPAASGFLVVQQSADVPAIAPGSGHGIAQPQKRTIAFQASGAPGDAAGSGACVLPFVVPPSMAGRTFACTAHLRDAAASNGLAQSNLLRLTFGL